MKIQILTLILGLAGFGTALGLFSGDASGSSGSHISRHGNGQMKESTIFVDGLRHGPTERWYADGNLRAKGLYENGKMQGEWIWLTPQGTPDASRSGVYEDGVRVSG